MDYTSFPSFAKSFEMYFKIGAAVNPTNFISHGELLKHHFNSLSPTVAMKFGPLQPEEGKWTFDNMDAIIAFSKANNMQVRAHAPVWHDGTNPWIWEDKGKNASRELLLERMEEHFKVVAGRYAGDVQYWDVVNEAIQDKGDVYLRKTKWLEIIGPDYLELAFKCLKKYAPNVQLFYNDYSEWVPVKREKIKRLLRELLDAGAPVEGMGLQAHLSVYDDMDLDDMKRAIEDYAAFGLRLHITELDISLFPREERALPASPITDEVFERQAKFYKELFAMYRSYSDVIDNVTFWGVADDITWLDRFPLPGRKNYPLAFYADHRPKPFLKEIIEDALLGK